MPDNEQNEKMRMLIPFQNGLNPLYSSISIKPRSGEVYSIQRYVIKFVRDLRQIGGFFSGISVSSTNKTDCHSITEILLKVALSTISHQISISNDEGHGRKFKAYML
jgi:hypothetical protein